MTTERSETARRPRLTRARVLAGALELADQIGVEAFTMRKLADVLEVKPMSIYHHVPSKEEIIDGIVDLVFGEIDLPPDDLDWRAAVRIRCQSAREVLNRHPWAPPYLEGRTTPGPASLGHHDAMLGCFRRGLPIDLVAHAYAIIDSYVYGFALQEASLPFGGGEGIADLADDLIEAMPADVYPNLVEFTRAVVVQPGYSFGSSFEFGLDLILDGLQTIADTRSG